MARPPQPPKPPKPSRGAKPFGRFNWKSGQVENQRLRVPITGGKGYFRYVQAPSGAGAAPSPPAPSGYRRGDVTEPDEEGYVWLVPSPTAWPNVKPDGFAGRPPGPRTQIVGYSISERKVRTVFRDGTPWAYSDVTPDEWERIRRTASTGRFINRVLNSHPYGREEFTPPAPVVFYPR